ncbi:DsbC family protein [Methylohalobius crimeensis]|uniref:DsbC family protein n=1 Tax=Methylohalobius crimeensis TaxID=244365 RepID=UPI0003B4DBCF|nr:DsbC family protein [Methylohalobius crimeensis]
MTKFLFPLLLGVGLNVQAAEPDQLRQALEQHLPGATIDSIQKSEIPGLYEVAVGPHLYYVSEDGRYLLNGHLIDLSNRTDLTEAKLSKARLASLDEIGEESMIIFAPDEPKHTVSVFTDIDCGYCRKFHSQIDAYLEKGIKVRYLFYPRAGKGSNSYHKAIAVWCSKDRNASLTAAKQGETPEMKSCDHPVDQHMALAEEFGVRGTPMIVTDSGEVLPGFVPPDALAQHLGAQ